MRWQGVLSSSVASTVVHSGLYDPSGRYGVQHITVPTFFVGAVSRALPRCNLMSSTCTSGLSRGAERPITVSCLRLLNWRTSYIYSCHRPWCLFYELHCWGVYSSAIDVHSSYISCMVRRGDCYRGRELPSQSHMKTNFLDTHILVSLLTCGTPAVCSKPADSVPGAPIE